MKNTLLPLFLLLILLLSACGGGETTTTLQVDMVEFMFEPKTFTVPAGQEITLELVNKGAIEHDFVILKQGVVAEGNFDRTAHQADILFEARLAPGKSDTFTFTIDAPGEYQVICSIPGHLAAGMAGKLIAR
ncbi:MAG: cupredoxin domain-containing protein [Anaerolineales bacterium]|nr:cupredoxin domain-containing protein [Anaerolineales bacterium]